MWLGNHTDLITPEGTATTTPSTAQYQARSDAAKIALAQRGLLLQLPIVITEKEYVDGFSLADAGLLDANGENIGVVFVLPRPDRPTIGSPSPPAPLLETAKFLMGITPNGMSLYIAASVLLITAQRLARKLCENCKAPADYPREALLKAGFKPEDLDGNWKPFRAVGCSMCNNGYKGRVGIYQVMPITEEIQKIILNTGSSMDIADKRNATECVTCAIGPAQGSIRRDDTRRTDLGHQRVANEKQKAGFGPRRRMATASIAAKGRIKDIVFEWEGKDKNGKPVRGEMRAGGEAMVSASLRRQGVMVNKVKKRRMSGGKAIKQKDIAVFTRQLSTMMKAGVPLIQSFDIVARGSANPKLTRLLDRHPLRRRDRHQPLGGVPQAPALFRRPLLQPGRGRRSGRYSRNPARSSGHLQGKDDGDQEQDQVGADLPDRGARGRVRRSRGDHDLRHPGVQGRVQVLRRRPARADAGRHRHVEDLRLVLVPDLRRHLRRLVLLHAVWKRSIKMQKFMDRLLLRVPVFGDLSTSRRSRAGRARSRPCSPPASRWSKRSTRSAAPRAMRSLPRRPRRSRRTSRPAPR